ncbi:MAG: PQQ-dependent sugar dehydrogenase, partial [Verrucomicrobiae bacterium]|nr:PQQ-dependent sugar dehydrogenase [Verrucomicrobiae bacterium]
SASPATSGSFRVSRFRWELGASEIASNAEERLLEFQLLAPGMRHFGGQIAFGPDGYLYVGVGDGGVRADQHHPSQQLDDLRGKILRINVHPPVGDEGKTYLVPADNPFVNHEGARPEIWAYGLRNPWRFDFDPMTGDLFIPDLGEETQEEINFQAADAGGGQNYGWPYFEGMEPIVPDPPDDVNLTEPVFVYGKELGSAVIGGFVFRHPSVAHLQGAYVFGDYSSHRIFALQREGADWTLGEILGPSRNFSDLALSPEGGLLAADATTGVSRTSTSVPLSVPSFSSKSGPGTIVDKIKIDSRYIDKRLIYRYTFDGTDPDESSQPIADRSFYINVPELPSFTFKFRAFPPGGAAPGPILEGEFQAGTWVQIESQDFDRTGQVKLTPWPSDAVIHYTLDGSEPDATSSALAPGETIPLDSFAPIRIRAVALHPEFVTGELRDLVFERQVLRVESLVGERGFMRPGQELVLSSPLPGAIIRYTLDDTEPTAESAVYTGGFIPPPGQTVKAKAFVGEFASPTTEHGGDQVNPLPVRAIERIAGAPELETGAASRIQAPALDMRFVPKAIHGNSERLFVGSSVQFGLYEVRDGMARLVVRESHGDMIALPDQNILIASLSSSHQIVIYNLDSFVVEQILGSADKPSNNDGSAQEATFTAPSFLAPAPGGGVYIVSLSGVRQSVVRHIRQDRSVETFAGNGTIKVEDTPVPKNEAMFGEIYGLVTDLASGVIYLLEGNGRILKLEGGMVSELLTIQASQSRTTIDGALGTATFRQIRGLAIDSDGNLFLIDKHVRRLDTKTGQVNTIDHNIEDLIRDVEVTSTGEIFLSTDHSVFRVSLADRDGDRIPDHLEPEASVGINDMIADDDGDGIANAADMLFENRALSLRAAVIAVPGSDRISIVFPRTIGKSYRIDTSPNLVDWNPIPDSAPRVDGLGIGAADIFGAPGAPPQYLRVVEF